MVPTLVIGSLTLLPAVPTDSSPAPAQQILEPAAVGTESDSASVLWGTVVDHATSHPLPGAAVSLELRPRDTAKQHTRVTDSDGRFLFEHISPGSYQMTVRLLGYHALRDTLSIEGGISLQLSLKLSVDPVEMDPIEVVARRRLRGRLADFERRRRSGLGTHITPEQIEARLPAVVTDLLRTVPGVRVTPTTQPGGQLIHFRGNCRPVIIVDGIRTTIGTDIDHVLPASTVEAVEVYQGAQLPARLGNHPCGAVVFWTVTPGDTGTQGFTWKSIGFASAFILLALVAVF